MLSPDGGTCIVTVTAAQTVTATFNTSTVTRIGNTTPFTETSGASPNYLLGELITVPSNVTLLQFGVISRGAGQGMQMALYTNVGSAPGTLVAQTAATTMFVGNMEMNPTAGPVALPAGTYWIMAIYNATAQFGFTTMAGTNVVSYRSWTYGTPLPTTFGTPITYTGQSFNYYLVVQ